MVLRKADRFLGFSVDDFNVTSKLLSFLVKKIVERR